MSCCDKQYLTLIVFVKLTSHVTQTDQKDREGMHALRTDGLHSNDNNKRKNHQHSFFLQYVKKILRW